MKKIEAIIKPFKLDDVGYQVPGTLGYALLNGAKKVKLFGEEIKDNLIRLADFSIKKTFEIGTNTAHAAIDTLININLQISGSFVPLVTVLFVAERG